MNHSRHSAAEVLGVLARTGWLSEQPGEFQERIARAGRWITVPKGARLYSVGEVAAAMFGLGEGLLDISIPISQDEEVTVHRAPPGFWIGDGALLSTVPRQLSVEAATECLIFHVRIGAVQRMLEANPKDWMYFYRLSSMNATLAVRTLAEVIALPTRARFARLLLRIAAPDGTVHVTQEELGRMAGMSRAAFRRTCSSLIRSGAVKTMYGGLVIRDAAALAQVANAR
jgi:CRP/FNR family cyclic AMP-dependent transcriptional regulator